MNAHPPAGLFVSNPSPTHMAGIYIHVPFCTQRCIYCDFYSQTDERLRADYLRAIRRELEMRADELGGEAVETIYFGGGTPSQLHAADFAPIFRTIQQHYDASACREITLEANPDDITDTYLRDLRTDLPFDRISLGVQSFSDADLRRLNRRHDAAEAILAVRRCLDAGFTNLSIDLIYGLPDQTTKAWARNLDTALRLGVTHLSAYHLSYEEGTPIYRQLQQGSLRAVDEETSVSLYHMLTERAAAEGWVHYEVSNFCRPGRFARHNTAYWTGAKYLGIGPSAHSYDGRSRRWNVASLRRYIAGIAARQPDCEREVTDDEMRYNEYLMTRLRTMWGVRLSVIREAFGERRVAHFLRHAAPYLAAGQLVRRPDNDTVRLTEEAFFISDGIISELFVT